MAKNRLSVAPPMVLPPRMKRATQSPIIGMRPACSAATTTDHAAGESHSESKSQQQDSSGPSHLARKFVGAKQERLRHMRSDHQHHRGRAIVMKSAQKT